MIKTNVGNTQLEGNIPIFLADIGSICGSVKEVLMEKGFSEESADKMIKEFVELLYLCGCCDTWQKNSK